MEAISKIKNNIHLISKPGTANNVAVVCRTKEDS